MRDKKNEDTRTKGARRYKHGKEKKQKDKADDDERGKKRINAEETKKVKSLIMPKHLPSHS